jgi:5-hydroxyisourate hydrolase-like protein (transthyretin family)
MKRLCSAALFVTLSLAAQDAPPPASANIEGRVVGKVINSANGEPVRKVTVTLGTRKGARGTSYIAESDANGKFAIEAVEPGEYTISADRQGFIVKPPGASGIPLPPLKVESGQSVPELTITLVPLGVITGRVMDEDGDPIRGADVRAMQYGYVAGKRQLRNANQVSADEKGEFRLYGLRPGTFYLQASGHNSQMSFVQPGDQIRGFRQPSGHAPTYYPSVTDVARAVPVEVTAGALLRGIDIHLRREAIYAVRGKFPQDESRQNSSSYMVQLFPREGNRNGGFGTRRTNDIFEIPSVLPGSYTLVGMHMDGDKRTYAYQPVEMANQDVDVGTLTFSPGSNISGVVHIEGGKERPPDLHVSLQPESLSMFGSPSGEVKQDGSFVLHDVAPGVYQVNLGAVPGAYLKSIQIGDHTLQDRHLDLTQVSGQLTVVLASDVGQVEGAVKKADGEPAVRVRVTLVPEGDQAGRQELSRFAFSNEKGEYKIINVPPGEYKIFAWEEVQAGAPQDPEFRKPFEKRGVAIKIPSNGHASADLTVISVAETQQPKQ